MKRVNGKFGPDDAVKFLLENIDCARDQMIAEDQFVFWLRQTRTLSTLGRQAGWTPDQVNDFLKQAQTLRRHFFADYSLHSARMATHFRFKSSIKHVIIKGRVPEVETQNPPQKAELLLHLLLPHELRQSLPGDLEEEYRTIIVPKFGERAAKWWYWKQVITSVGPVFRSRLWKWAAAAWFGKVTAWLTGKITG